MTIREDGTIFIEAGTAMPFVCPVCLAPKEYEPGRSHIQCDECDHVGTPEEFSKRVWRRDEETGSWSHYDEAAETKEWVH